MASVIAHRGNWARARENTLPALTAAVDLGVDVVEVDLRLTRDGEVVLLHDPTLDRLWDDPVAIGALSLADVRARTGAAADGGIPTLGEALDAVGDVPLLLDLPGPEVVDAMLAVIADRRAAGRVLYCGDHRASRLVRDAEPTARIALTWKSAALPDDELLRAMRPAYVNFDQRLVDQSTVDVVHARGFGVSAWTVDDPARMTALLDLGVDAITTNQPALLLDVQRVRTEE